MQEVHEKLKLTVECKITIQSKIILEVYKIEGNNRF